MEQVQVGREILSVAICSRLFKTFGSSLYPRRILISFSSLWHRAIMFAFLEIHGRCTRFPFERFFSDLESLHVRIS